MADEHNGTVDDGQLAVATALESAPPAPVAETERLSSLDILRGVAVLGILAINIQQMGLPQAALSNPKIMGPMSFMQTVAWSGVVEFFLQKFMSIFAMLFGAGTVLLAARIVGPGREFTPVYFRRMVVLLAIGMVHAYFIWWGDILVAYAICGMIIYFMRNWSPRRLLVVGAVVFLLPTPAAGGLSVALDYIQGQATSAQAKIEAGQTVTADEQNWIDTWAQIAPSLQPSPEQVQKEIDANVGGYGTLFAHRALLAIMYQTFIFFFFSLWKTIGLMMAGMALMKLGVFSLGRSSVFYGRMALFGLGVGLPLDAFGISHLLENDFAPGAQVLSMGVINYFASVATAMGYVGVAMLLCRAAVAAKLKDRFAAVGRMALSNYLMHSIVFTTVFYGYGLGLFGEIPLISLLGLMALMWLAQLWISPVWLAAYRFGPVEWLWRSLTYGKRQPMRRG